MIRSGKLAHKGMGTLNKTAGPGLIFRGEGLTLVLKALGEFWTLLKSGAGMDLKIVMVG
ncbi:hypothetical protein [Streptomyces sp. NBC_00576]|uniref:hypothetical protein n=1 Tax=Streptomyces sp. NBC_00576 TaxID=2903665 RepID=UPI002E805B32|nr:hypothetical protein [Streptomyces sp. NBC_00576]WUB72232.1 hypothetical protein OG734_20130 [Streptomyces sp. NBC_00576]